jgi:hypothetical protein
MRRDVPRSGGYAIKTLGQIVDDDPFGMSMERGSRPGRVGVTRADLRRGGRMAGFDARGSSELRPDATGVVAVLASVQVQQGERDVALIVADATPYPVDHIRFRRD